MYGVRWRVAAKRRAGGGPTTRRRVALVLFPHEHTESLGSATAARIYCTARIAREFGWLLLGTFAMRRLTYSQKFQGRLGPLWPKRATANCAVAAALGDAAASRVAAHSLRRDVPFHVLGRRGQVAAPDDRSTSNIAVIVAANWRERLDLHGRGARDSADARNGALLANGAVWHSSQLPALHPGAVHA